MSAIAETKSLWSVCDMEFFLPILADVLSDLRGLSLRSLRLKAFVQVGRLFLCLGRRRSSSLLAGWSFSMEWHNGIVHGRFEEAPVGTSLAILRIYKFGG